MNKEIKKYLKECKKVFPFIGNKEKIFLKRIEENIIEYISEKNNVTYQELVNQFGLPKDIMVSYVQDCDNDYIVKKMNIKKLIKRISITVCTILIIGLSFIIYFEYKTAERAKDRQIITEETVIQYE